MANSPEVVGSTMEKPPSCPPPSWELVRFRVTCARCGEDLHGRVEPSCPRCGLTFDWAQAVPLEELLCAGCGYHLYGLSETRCPECGTAFTWEQALEDYHRRRKPLFEYRWRTEPLRSLVRTWWLSLQPWKLWRSVDLHDPPRVWPLLAMILLACALFWLAGVVPAVLFSIVDHILWTRQLALSGRAVPPGVGLRTVLPGYLQYALQSSGFNEVGRGLLAWISCTFASLLVFQQSMRMCRIRTVHVFRVCTYAGVGLPAVVAFIGTTFPRVCAWVGLGFSSDPPALAAGGCVIVLFGTLSIGVAYQRYLRMPHVVAVVLAAQIMAILSTGIVLALGVIGFDPMIEAIFKWASFG